MTAAVIEWMSGPAFWVVFLGGLIIGVITAGVLAAARRVDEDTRHVDLLRALERIYIGLRAGWTSQDAIDEAERALDLDQARR